MKPQRGRSPDDVQSILQPGQRLVCAEDLWSRRYSGGGLFDRHSLGVIDHVQTVIDTVDGTTGDRIETVSDDDGQGQLTRNVTTTTSADGTLVTIVRDLTGSGIADQIETRQTGADGAVADTLRDVSADGTTIDETVTSSSADGLSSETQVDITGRVDAAGNPAFDRTTIDTTAVAARHRGRCPPRHRPHHPSRVVSQCGYPVAGAEPRCRATPPTVSGPRGISLQASVSAKHRTA